jgi:hypothetical protein
MPLNIFDTFSLPMATIDLNEATSGGGFITSRKWDANGNIIDGYYMSFEILEANILPVPIPSALWLLGSGLAAFAGVNISSRKKQLITKAML